MACGPAGHRGEGVAREGSALLVTALPVLADEQSVRGRGEETVMDRVVIGVDPHKRSVTFEARDTREPSWVLCRSHTGCGSRLRAA